MSSSSETKNQLFVILCLTISLTKSQRVTLLSSQLTSNIDGWLTDNTLSSVNGFIVNNPTYCPSGGNCYTFSTNDEFYRHIDTRGYRDIQIGYDIRTLNTRGDLGYACRFYWMKGTRVSGDPGWVHQQSHVCDSATCNILHTALPNDVDNTKTICIDFWMDSPGWCHLNNVVITGIPITTSVPTLNPITAKPTAKPTANPTDKQTPQPTTLNPTVRPTDPGVSTCDETVIGAYNGVPVTFVVHIPFQGDLQLNAQSSTFEVTDMEAFTKLSIPLATDVDEDRIVTLSDVPPGDYKLIIFGQGATSGTFEISIRCFSTSPTSYPTPHPTLSPTHKPTSDPTLNPTRRPSLYPTRPPLNPTLDPTRRQSASTQDLEVTEDEITGLEPLEDTFMHHPSVIEISIMVIGTLAGCCVCCLIGLCGYSIGKRYVTGKEVQAANEIQIDPLTSANTDQKPRVVPLDDDLEMAHFDRVLVTSWIQTQLKLPQYVSVFVDQGYDSMRFIQAIENRRQLIDLGIHKMAHQTLILHEIKKIRDTDIDYKTGTEDGGTVCAAAVGSLGSQNMVGESNRDGEEEEPDEIGFTIGARAEEDGPLRFDKQEGDGTLIIE
eukprot:797544_1